MKKLGLLLLLLMCQNALSQGQPKFLKLKNYRVAYLSDSLRETSGLTLLGDKLYTFNDGGNTSDIFEIDKKSGKILTKIKTGFQNTDWEAMTTDGRMLYIGDFGNNAGSRQDLNIKIFRLDQDASDNAADIHFKYPEQNDFTSQLLNTDFDAEGMVYINGQLHIFTKEWKTKGVSHYILDARLENQSATKTEAYQTNFFVTDTAYFDSKLFVVGYTRKTEVYLNIFSETEGGKFFRSAPQIFYLGSALKVGQIEGIAVDEAGIYISGEAFRTPLGNARQSFYFIPKNKLVE